MAEFNKIYIKSHTSSNAFYAWYDDNTKMLEMRCYDMFMTYYNDHYYQIPSSFFEELCSYIKDILNGERYDIELQDIETGDILLIQYFKDNKELSIVYESKMWKSETILRIPDPYCMTTKE